MTSQNNSPRVARNWVGAVLAVSTFGLASLDPWPWFSATLILSGILAGYLRPALAAALFVATYPLLDFVPWAGQWAMRHHDFLALGICAGWCLTRGPFEALPSARRSFWSWPGLYVAWVTVSAAIGYGWLQNHADPGAVVHLAPGNAFRVAKGAWLALLVVSSYPGQRAGGRWPAILTDMSRGVPWALIYMGCWYLLERLLFVGWGDWDRYFRIGGPLSGAANLGGQSSETVLLVLMAWSMLTWQVSHRLRPVVIFGLIFGSLALVLAQTRSTLMIALLGAALMAIVVTLGRRSFRQRLGWSLAGGLLVVVFVAIILSNPALRTRFKGVPADWRMRQAHYQTALGLVAEHPRTWLFGRGTGTFPTLFASGGPRDQTAGWFGIADGHGASALAVYGGQPSYLGWNVDRSLREAAMVRLRVRSESRTDFGVHLCEKNLMHSVACRSAQISPSGSGEWHWRQASLSGDRLEKQRWGPIAIARPLFLSIGTPEVGRRLQVARVELLSAEGDVLWRRDRFELGFPRALMTTDYYWPFHVENDALHTFIEQGMVGCLLLLAVLIQASRFAMRQPFPAGPILLAKVMVGVVVGIVNSPLDTPESATLWLIPVFALARRT